jgi:hypothetical protein
MRLRLVIFSFASALIIPHLDAQSPPAQVSGPLAAEPAIMGELLQGRYSNTILGVTLEFPANCQIEDLEGSESFSRELPRRMHLHFKCGEDRVLLAAFPVTPDEKLDNVFRVSFMGVRDAGGFQAVGKQMSTNIDGCEVLSQNVRRESESGVYRGFFSHGYYVTVLHFGPKSTEGAREANVLTLSVHAQSPVDKPSEGETTATKKVDPKLHADAVKLVEVLGAKQYLQDNLEKMADDGQKALMDKCQECTPEFGKEWKKRFIERTNLSDYLDVFVRAYEKYFTDAEINELIALKQDTSKTAVPSPALKEKLAAVMPALMADQIGDCSKLGAKLGGEIGAEIGREHPEYTKPPANSAKP